MPDETSTRMLLLGKICRLLYTRQLWLRRAYEEHPLATLHAEKISRARAGDIAAAQDLMRSCAEGLRGRSPRGLNNLPRAYADYLVDVLERLAGSAETARLFCLDMPKHRPKHRPKQPNDPLMHMERSRKVLKHFQDGGTLRAAITAVARSEHKSDGAILASWKAKGFLAEVELLLATPDEERTKLRLPGALDKMLQQPKGGT